MPANRAKKAVSLDQTLTRPARFTHLAALEMKWWENLKTYGIRTDALPGSGAAFLVLVRQGRSAASLYTGLGKRVVSRLCGLALAPHSQRESGSGIHAT